MISPDNNPPPSTDSREQWLEARLMLRSELKFDVRTIGTETVVVVEDPVRSKFFQIGTSEYRLLAALDGQKTIREILDQVCPTAGATEPATVSPAPENVVTPMDESQAIRVCQWLVQNNLAYNPTVDNIKRLDEQSRQSQRAKLYGWLNPISCKLKLCNPNRILSRLQPFTQWFFSPWTLLVWFVVGGYAMNILYSDWDKMGSASVGIFSGFSWVWLLLSWVGLKLIHETSHAVACRRYGGEVPEAGVLLLLFTPMAYVNVTSMWRFASRWQRIVVSVAGMYAELFVSFLALILWRNYPGVIGDVAFKVFMMASVTTILFNANPLMRFDGYFILSDLLNIPNLYTKGTRWFGDRFKHYFFGTPKTPNIYLVADRRFVQVYGVLAWFWKTTISLSLIIGAGVLFHGAGIILAALGVILWYGMPAWQQIRWFRAARVNGTINQRRLATSCLASGLLLIGMFTVLPAPGTKSAPAIVRYSDEQVVRAAADGFIRQILVCNGQAVTRGETLIVLENPQLVLDVEDLERLAAEATIESRIKTRAGELALAQAASERNASLLAQLAEKRQLVAQQTVTAPIDGFVFQRKLENRIDSFARAGEALLSIAHAETKEVVVSVDQRDLESIQGKEGMYLKVAFPGQPLLKTKLTRVNPRVSNRLQHDSWGANLGGPLPVQPVADESQRQEVQFELLDPRFTMDLSLEPAMSESLFAGQRGRAFFATNRQSLGSYLYLAAAEWLKQKIELAIQTATF